jgi:hemerythrin
LLNRDEVPRVALTEMNTVHEQEIDMLNELLVLLPQVGTYAEARHALDQRLQEFLDHLQTHFAGEEEHMRRHGFPVYPIHKGEHDRVYAELEQVINGWQREGDLAALRHYLYEVFPAWMFQHIASMDRVTALFLAEVTQSQG